MSLKIFASGTPGVENNFKEVTTNVKQINMDFEMVSGRLDKNPPPREKHIEPKEGDTLPADIAELSYEKYLREVTRILESDPDFKKKMENATREEVMSGLCEVCL